MGADMKPGDPADKAADGAFGGVTSHRAGYGDKLQRVEDWLRRHPTATLASGEGAVLLQEIDQLRRQIEIFVDMAADWVKVGHENERLQEENDDLRAAIDRVRALHVPRRGRRISCTLNTEANQKAAAEKHGVSIAHVEELMNALGGEGEFVDPSEAVDLWCEFSGSFRAGWMLPSACSLGNFAAWLILRKDA